MMAGAGGLKTSGPLSPDLVGDRDKGGSVRSIVGQAGGGFEGVFNDE